MSKATKRNAVKIFEALTHATKAANRANGTSYQLVPVSWLEALTEGGRFKILTHPTPMNAAQLEKWITDFEDCLKLDIGGFWWRSVELRATYTTPGTISRAVLYVDAHAPAL